MGKKSKGGKKQKKQGGGGRKTSQEKDRARIERAETQFAPATETLREAETAAFPPMRLDDDDGPRLRLFRAHDEECEEKCKLIDRLHGEMKYKKAAEVATEVIEKTRAFLRLMDGGIYRTAYFPIHHIQAFQVRAHSRYMLLDWKGAFDDATEGLAMIRLRKPAVDSPEPGVQEMEARLLFDRGCCLLYYPKWTDEKASLVNNEKLASAHADIRASLAAVRGSRAWCDDHKNSLVEVQELSKMFLWACTLRKVQSKAARPHYTAKELASLQKEASLGIFSFDRYKCLGCNALPGTVKLDLCGRCEKFWFCSDVCLKKSWKHLHKPTCKPIAGKHESTVIYFLSDFEKPAIDKRIADIGVCWNERPQDAERRGMSPLPHMIVRDPKTGLYYDSFSDHPFVFLPSQCRRISESFNHSRLDETPFAGFMVMANITGKMSKSQVRGFMESSKRVMNMAESFAFGELKRCVDHLE